MTRMARRDTHTPRAEITIGTRFLMKLPSFLWYPLSLQEARMTFATASSSERLDSLPYQRQAGHLRAAWEPVLAPDKACRLRRVRRLAYGMEKSCTASGLQWLLDQNLKRFARLLPRSQRLSPKLHPDCGFHAPGSKRWNEPASRGGREKWSGQSWRSVGGV